MRKIFILLSAIIYLASCSEDTLDSSYPYTDSTIYSTSQTEYLSEVILFLNPYIEDNGTKKYIVCEKIQDLVLKVNNKSWKISNSYILDTLHLNNKETVGGFRVTTETITYPFVVNLRTDTESPTTAGGYADLLNNYLSLRPGHYVCQIESFLIPNHSEKTFTPTLAFALEVKEKQVSANLGTFEIFIK
jgi:hypothetical protein